jgi:hypothetical protein
MATGKVVLRSIEEFMADYTPTYQPLYPLLLGKSQSYAEEVGELTFRRVQTVGDIRAGHITPKDTEIKQIAVSEGKKSFKKYFLANQFQISQLQNQEATEEVVAMVLDEHQKQMDELVLTGGEGGINNGLYTSTDPNYLLENSAEVEFGDGRLYDLHKKVVASATKADRIAGRKVVVFYGDNVVPLFNGLYENAVIPFKKALSDVLGAEYSLAKMPAEVTPSGGHGYMIVNLDQNKLHYTTLPALKDQGANDEKMYNWFNFLMGSTMVEVLAKNGVIRQPLTLASS